MDILKLPFVQGAIRMGYEGYNRGWHERNGGNLTYRLRPEEAALLPRRRRSASLSSTAPVNATGWYGA